MDPAGRGLLYVYRISIDFREASKSKKRETKRLNLNYKKLKTIDFSIFNYG